MHEHTTGLTWFSELFLPGMRQSNTSLQHWVWGWLVVPHQWFMMACTLKGMSPVPACATIVAETLQVPAEEGSLLNVAGAAEWVLQVRINLNLKSSVGVFQNLDTVIRDHLPNTHIFTSRISGRGYRIFMSVCLSVCECSHGRTIWHTDLKLVWGLTLIKSWTRSMVKVIGQGREARKCDF